MSGACMYRKASFFTDSGLGTLGWQQLTQFLQQLEDIAASLLCKTPASSSSFTGLQGEDIALLLVFRQVKDKNSHLGHVQVAFLN